MTGAMPVDKTSYSSPVSQVIRNQNGVAVDARGILLLAKQIIEILLQMQGNRED